MNPTTPDRITAAEIRALFKEQNARLIDLHLEIELLRDSLHAMREGLAQAATAPALPAQVGTFKDMMIDTIVMTYDDNGKPAYKGLGAPFQKFGVRIWDEILPQFVDPATLKPGKNAIAPTPARVLMNTPKEGKTPHRKVIGKA